MRRWTMLVRELMTTPAVTVRAGASLAATARVLFDNHISAAPVVDDNDQLVGIVGEIDLEQCAVDTDPRAHLMTATAPVAGLPQSVDDVMTKDVIAVPPGFDVEELVALMKTERVRSIPVVDGTRVLGIVSRRDVLALLVRTDEAVRTEVLSAIAQATGGHVVDISVTGGVVTIAATGIPGRDEIAALTAHTVPGVLRVRLRRQT
jgi:CBS domain-containing protein